MIVKRLSSRGSTPAIRFLVVLSASNRLKEPLILVLSLRHARGRVSPICLLIRYPLPRTESAWRDDPNEVSGPDPDRYTNKFC